MDGGSTADDDAESARLREPFEHWHQSEEIGHFQTALKFAYLKAMSNFPIFLFFILFYF